MTKETVLDVQHLSVSFMQYEKGVKQKPLPVIKDLSVKIHEGELVAIIGASGSGKSILAHAILGILPYNATTGGTILYRNEELTPKRIEKLRGTEISLVPQSLSYLDPLMKIGAQLQKGKRSSAAKKKASDILARFGLADRTKKLYPFELSGGMTRRALISTAVIDHPKLVIADEPTPGLDEYTARRVLSHFRELADDGAGVLLITHDLQLALDTADKVVVFYAGTTIEEAEATDFKTESTLRHPYTKALWRAMPEHGFHAIPGVQPYAAEMPEGCPFAPRCEHVKEECMNEILYRNVRNGYVRCILEEDEST